MSSELTLFSYMVLALVGRGGASPYELQRMARQGRIYDWAGESQYYVEPKRLAKLGYLDARARSRARRASGRSTRLTDQGLEALREWAGSALCFPRLQHEALVLLLAADLVDEGDVRASLVVAAGRHRRPLGAARRGRGRPRSASRTARSTS